MSNIWKIKKMRIIKKQKKRNNFFCVKNFFIIVFIIEIINNYLFNFIINLYSILNNLIIINYIIIN